MIRKLSAFLITCILLAAATVVVFAEQEEAGILIYNSEIVSNDLDATYIEGEIPVADGQEIIVTHGAMTVASKPMPQTGTKAEFRIKIPASVLDPEGVTSLRVKASAGATTEESLPARVSISYKQKEKQTIDTSSDDYELTVPGIREPIDAKSSAKDVVTYSSADPKVVDIDEKGNLVPVGKGEAEVKVRTIGSSRYEGAEKTVKVSVKEIDGFKIAFHSSISDDEDEITEQIIPTGSGQALAANSFENGDHEFLGWATSDDGLVEYLDTASVGDIAEQGETKDLYAVWTGDGARAAAAWGVKIANDDSFAYGYKPATAKPGCYFCGTNQRNKPSGYEKTYVCMTFVHACYAHGAEDPEMLADCRRGKYTVSLNDWNFSHWSCWTKVGRSHSLSVGDLEPGDVIIWWADDDASGHASMYIGNGDIVDAAVEGWGSNTIAVRRGAAASYLRRGEGRSYVMRYVGPNA